MKRKKKHKWKLLLIIIIIGVGIFMLLNSNILNKVTNIIPSGSYSESSFRNIDNTTKEEILNNKYSKMVDEALIQGLFDKDYLDIYYNVKYQDEDEFIENINMLAEIGYNADDINTILNKVDYDNLDQFENTSYLKNIGEFLELDYFKPQYINRYSNYQKENDYDVKTIVTYVNIGLDYDFYDTKIVKEITDSNDELVLVNKYNKLPSNYSPTLTELSSSYSIKSLEVTFNTKVAFEDLVDAAAAKRLNISAVSTYRTFSYQQNLYNNYVANDGKTNADKYSARPGFSEHHTGLAIDVQGGNKIYSEFDSTEEYSWVKDNAHLYGFIIRYPKDKENITGYMYEAWHLRYVGVKVATYIYKHDITFDEYHVRFLEN